MVDECQDANVLQARVTNLLVGERRDIMVVGDDAQSVYAFRGACYENLFELRKAFSRALVTPLEPRSWLPRERLMAS